MPRGVIKFFNESRGYGFIQSEEEASRDDVFVHYSQIDDGERPIREGAAVEFDVRQSDRGLEAINVHKLS